MLHFMRKGDRNPSTKVLERIIELESSAGINWVLAESPSAYTVGSVPKKPAPEVDDPVTDEIFSKLRSMQAQIELMTKTINLLLDERKPREKP